MAYSRVLYRDNSLLLIGVLYHDQKFSFRWNKPLKDQQNEAEVTDIVALSSHKTHSTPVDPIELKKRLVDLLIQRTTKGDQQALKLKVRTRFYRWDRKCFMLILTVVF